MSGEFGSYDTTGYVDDQIETAAEDCLKGSNELTRLWGAFLKECVPIFSGICHNEACDSGPDYPIEETIRMMPSLLKRLAAISAYVKPFETVAENARREAINDLLKKQEAERSLPA